MSISRSGDGEQGGRRETAQPPLSPFSYPLPQPGADAQEAWGCVPAGLRVVGSLVVI